MHKFVYPKEIIRNRKIATAIGSCLFTFLGIRIYEDGAHHFVCFINKAWTPSLEWTRSRGILEESGWKVRKYACYCKYAQTLIKFILQTWRNYFKRKQSDGASRNRSKEIYKKSAVEPSKSIVSINIFDYKYGVISDICMKPRSNNFMRIRKTTRHKFRESRNL